MMRAVGCLLLWPGLAMAGPCVDFAHVDLVMLPARLPYDTAAETSAVQQDCAAMLVADPRDKVARRELGRAQLAARLLAQADENLAELDRDGDAEAPRLRVTYARKPLCWAIGTREMQSRSTAGPSLGETCRR